MRPELEETLRLYFRSCALLDSMRFRLWDRDHLTVTQLRLLVFLSREDGLGNAELADRLYVTRPSVSALLDRLERGNYLKREVSATDRRAIVISLTDLGREAIDQLGGELMEYTEQLFGELDGAQLAQVKAALELLVETGIRSVDRMGLSREG